eukprot:4990435-Prymnesium_polylepis.1
MGAGKGRRTGRPLHRRRPRVPMAKQAMAQMEMAAYDEQPTSAGPRVAAAAAPHKRQAVAAGTA